MKTYRLWAAVAYELLRLLCDHGSSLWHHPVIKALMEAWRPDWVEWKTKSTMQDVDQQVDELHERWAAAERIEQAPIITEKPSDGSNAQQLLGGEMRIRAPWVQE